MVIKLAILTTLISSLAANAENFSEELLRNVNSIANRKLSASYPDEREWEKKLIDDMPRLTGNETRGSEFDEFRRRLSRHGKLIEDFNGMLLGVCEKLNAVDNELKALAKIKWITQGYYEELKVAIIEEKRNCDSTAKVGPYWDIYDSAVKDLKARESEIEDERAKCEKDHPQSCV